MLSYTANALNQYTAIANPDAVGLRGSATNAATVTVNGNAAMSDDIASAVRPWHFALAADNAAGGLFALAEIVAVVDPPGTNTPDIVSTANGTVYAPPQNEALTYDDDGNLLSDGRWHYTWNGENRLVKAEEQVAPTNRQPYVVEYAYDHQGRMVRKEIKRRDAESQSETPVKAIAYAWDGYNIIAETVAQDNVTNTTYNVWGLDLDGTMQGAGGVGGLLAVMRSDGAFFPAYDANGNITEYIAADGALAAHREYDPFGNTVVATGDAARFTHWFSTKPWCSVTGLSEYQYRKYSPVLGRWLSRDPMEESGGLNTYLCCGNCLLHSYDIKGLAYFSYRPLDVFGLRHLGVWGTLSAELHHRMLAHEQLFFEDHGLPSNLGFFNDNLVRADHTPFGYCRPHSVGWDDCVMRRAVRLVVPRRYSTIEGPSIRQYNCQDWASDVRTAYLVLIRNESYQAFKCCIRRRTK